MTNLVCHHSPGQVGHGLELVVDEQLRRHHDETKGEEEAVAGAQHEAVPSLVHGC